MDTANLGVGELCDRMQRQGLRLPFEVGAFIALESCEALIERPSDIAPQDVLLDAEGQVSVRDSERPTTSTQSAQALSAVLARLLVAAGPGVPPTLLALAEPTGDPLPLERVRDVLTASLIPLNRSASRRVVARLVRETVRPPAAAPVLEQSPPDDPQLDNALDALLGEAQPRYVAPAPPKQVVPPVPQEVPPPPTVQQALTPPPIPLELSNLSVEQEVEAAFTAISTLPPPADAVAVAEAVAEAETVTDTEPVPAPVSVSASIHGVRAEGEARRESAAKAEQSEGRGGRNTAGAGGRDNIQLVQDLAPALEPEPLPTPRRSFGPALIGLLSLLSLAAIAWWALGPRQAPQIVDAPSAAVSVGEATVSAPADGSVFLFVGRSPTTAEGLSSDADHRFVAIADNGTMGEASTRPGAGWQQTDRGLLYELAVQVLPGTQLTNDDRVVSRLAGDAAVRIVTTPPDIAVYRYVGHGPEVVIRDLRVDLGHELLFIGPNGQQKHVLTPSDWRRGSAGPTASIGLAAPSP